MAQYPELPHGDGRVEESALAEPATLDDPYSRLKPSLRHVADAIASGATQTDAWISAGYSPQSAKQNASEAILTNPDLQAAIEQKKADLAARAGVSQQKIAATLHDHAFHTIADLYRPGTFEVKPPSEWPEALQHVIEEVTYIAPSEKSAGHVKVKFVNRQAALKMLGEYKGMWQQTDRGGERWTLNIGGDVNIGPNAGADQRQQTVDVGHLQIGGS